MLRSTSLLLFDDGLNSNYKRIIILIFLELFKSLKRWQEIRIIYGINIFIIIWFKANE